MTVNGGAVNDTVANWVAPPRAAIPPPSSTSPSPQHPSTATVYLSGNYDVPGTGIPASDDWGATDYPMTKTGTSTWTLTLTGVPAAAFQYKLTLGSWGTVEETSGCGFVNNRDFGFDTAGASFTANDTVAAWQGSGGC